ncbi:hypothetical protein [Salipaludibacillus daqingensis]|uniref:hypothetical protein n=1 Tax=Salipaludibacillus daqingensis TaxID=3041001 RepID=UPI0024761D1D|nr:hypothetical protein [Salipaludibacillus daqingensis]
MSNSSRTIDFKYAPKMIQTCIGLVDDPYKSIVREDGSLNYHFEEKEFDPGDFYINKDEGPKETEFVDENIGFQHRLKPMFTHQDEFVKRNQTYDEPELPFVYTEELYKHSYLKWTTFSYQNNNGLRADVLIWELGAKEGFVPAPTKVALKLSGDKTNAPKVMESADTTKYWTKDGFNIRGITHYDFLQEKDVREGVFVIVLEGNMPVSEVTLDWAKKAKEEMRSYWKNIRLFETAFQIPDQQVMDMLKASARNMLQAREIKEGLPEFQVGPTVYRGLWVIDGHFLLEAAHMMGKRLDAYQGVEAVLKRAKEDGSIQIIPSHFKETGIALATFVRQCELMNDDERLKQLWPIMCKALDYIIHMRKEAVDTPDYKGIFPPAFLDGGIAGPFPEYTTPLWIAVGLKRAYEEGERLQLERKEEFKTVFMDVESSLREAIKRDLRKREDGIMFFKMNMMDREYDLPQSATWALAHAIYPGELFAEDDPVVQNFLQLLDSIDDTQGIPENTGWIHNQAVWGYSSMFYAQDWLYAGNPEKAIDYLYSFANHAAPSRVWREEQSFTSSNAAEYCGDMPHNWASAEFIRLVRHLLVLEKKDTLEIFRGLPEQWLPTDHRILHVENTPTKFGEVTIKLEKIDDNSYDFYFARKQGNKEPSQVGIYWMNEYIPLDRDEVRLILRTNRRDGSCG